jgi:hypothetical protein
MNLRLLFLELNSKIDNKISTELLNKILNQLKFKILNLQLRALVAIDKTKH